MKRLIALFPVIFTIMTLLTSCASVGSVSSKPVEMSDSAYQSNSMTGTSGAGTAEAPAAAAPSMAPGGEREDEYYSEGGLLGTPIVSQSTGGALAEKIIYSVYAELEAIKFDETLEKVYAMLETYGAFIENSYVGGRNYAQAYYNYQAYRSARFTLRVPKDKLNDITSSLSDLGNVTNLSSDAQNITAQFYDNESRLTAARTEEQRLLEMLEKADTVADMITIEARLSEVRYNIEALTSTQRNWQNQVDYSTLTISIQEVEILSEITPIQRTYGQQIGDGFKSTLKGIGTFFKNLLKWVIVELPVIVIIVIIVLIAVFSVKKLRRKRSVPKDRDE